MTGDEIKALREKLLRFLSATEPKQASLVLLTGKEMAYLAGLTRSHMIWRDWLIPGE